MSKRNWHHEASKMILKTPPFQATEKELEAAHNTIANYRDFIARLYQTDWFLLHLSEVTEIYNSMPTTVHKERYEK